MNTTTVTPKELYDRVKAGQQIELIDVRTPAEFREIHVDLERNVKLDKLDERAIA